jgi:membrane protein DedA with SNARE-associated domain
MLTSLAHWVQGQVAGHGLWAVFFLMVLESACIPLPSEVTMIYAGYLVSRGDMVFWQAVLAGAVANLLGSWIAYAAGYWGVDLPFVRGSHARLRIDQARGWFERFGAPVVFFSRLVPLIRTFISLPAGVARMRFALFSVLTFLGCLPWCAFLVWVGDAAGSNWDAWHRRIGYLDYVVAALLAAAACWWVLRRGRARVV